MQRENWSSRLTYILTVAGATIGFGATWRFPYLVGQNGGGAYVLVFCLAMILVGVPVILAENVIGRRSAKNAMDAYVQDLGDGKKNNKAWMSLGYMSIGSSFLILAYYMVLGGWVLGYIINILLGNFDVSDPVHVTTQYTAGFFEKHIENSPLEIGFYTFIFVAVNWFILRKGIIEGIERSVKFLMPALFICLAIIVARNLTLSGAAQGVSFYLSVDFSKITGRLFIEVLGQVFFALSLGIGVMVTLSSHLDKKENLLATAGITGVLNTVVAVLCGFMIFPALFTAGLDPSSGPSLVFKTLPVAFAYIPFGNVIAVLFFVLLVIAALTTSITLYQVIICIMEEKWGFSKKSATNWCLGLIFVFGNIPSVLAYGPWRDIKIFGMNIFDAFDFFSGNIFFVLTALFSCIYVGWVLKENAVKELSNEGTNNHWIIAPWYWYVKFVVPVIISIIFVYGIFFS